MTKHSSLALAVGAVFFAFPGLPLSAQGTPDPLVDQRDHVIRRITWGTTSDLRNTVGTGVPALTAFINAQLNPPAVGAPNYYGSQSLNELLTGPGAGGTIGTLGLPATIGGAFTRNQAWQTQMALPLESQWQLREVMTYFWENHFNTHLFSRRGYFVPYVGAGNEDSWSWWFEWEANEFYREKCFGTFHDLLLFTTQHVSMQLYLHIPQNKGSNGNENYAREVLELFSCGKQHLLPTGQLLNNYGQVDVQNVARILTGFGLDNQSNFVFQYTDADHAYSPTPTVLFASSAMPVTIPVPAPMGGLQEGLDLLRELAGHPGTADFICRKLIAHFIDEGLATTASSPVLTAMLNAWGQFGDIKAVLTQLLTSAEFLGPNYRWTRIRIPYENVVATARAADGMIRKSPPAAGGLADPLSLTGMLGTMLLQGQQLFLYPPPIGFPTSNNSQLSPSLGVEKARWGVNTVLFLPPNLGVMTDPVGFVATAQPAIPPNPTAANIVPHLFGVVDYMLTSLYGSNYTLADEQRVVDGMLEGMAWVQLTYGVPWDPAVPVHYATVITTAFATALGMVQSGRR